MLPRHAAVGLAEALEDMRQEFGGQPDARVADRDFDARVDPLEAQLNLPVLRRELHRVGEQVPDDLPQPIGIAGDRAHVRIDHRVNLDPLGVRGRRDRLHRVL